VVVGCGGEGVGWQGIVGNLRKKGKKSSSETVNERIGSRENPRR
jgi:hypothetical protein